jgi:pimeloyl-ACP methyl ester carboxylesterase
MLILCLWYMECSRWENYRLVPQLRVPILFISGLADELIPPGMYEPAP